MHTSQRESSRTPPRVLLETGLCGLALGLLVVAPWIGSGYLLLLDWVSGPEQAVTPGVYGLSGSALDAMPFRIGTAWLRGLVGPAVTAWLLIAAFFPVAAAGAAAAAGGGRWRAYPAALLMVCNPFVVDRIRAGHVAVLLGTAILPWLFAAALHARRAGKPFAVRPALYYALAISISPHMAWLGGVLLVAVAVLPRPSRTDLVRTLQVVVTASLVYGYALVLYAVGTKTLAVTRADLEAYATAPGPGGWLPTVASLQGFWRRFDDSVGAGLGPLLGSIVLIAVLAVVVAGLSQMWGRELDRAAPLVALTALGLLLGAGMSGPLAGLYGTAFDVLPLFEAMREQQKWLALAVLGYAVGFGHGVAWLLEHRPRPVAVAAGLLPLVVAPFLIWGLGGTIRTSQYPAGWAQAAEAMGPGEGAVLFLPWHAYQPFDFTDGRTVATPAAAFFERPVLVSDAVELPGLRTDSTSLRSAYVDRIVGAGGADALGALLAPLGVEYIAVARTAAPEDLSWVAGQPEVEQVLANDAMTLYRVTRSATGRVVGSRVADFDQTVQGYGQGWGSEAVLPQGEATGQVPSSAAGGIERVSATQWSVAAGPVGWVVIPEEWSAGWQADDGTAAVPTLAGTAAVRVGPEPTQVRFAPWRYLRPAILGSLTVLAALIIGGLVEHQRELRRLRRRPAASPRRPGPS